LASTCVVAETSEPNVSETYFLQAYEHAEEAYIVRYVMLSNSKKLSMDMVSVTADIEVMLKGSRNVFSQIEFYRLYDFDIGDQSHLVGSRFVVLYTKIKGEVAINPQDPMSVKMITPELDEILSKLR
jgi:hypothetical protein